ncbi:M949_RS01915 family surface polysaccharide biosynthesis protein [Flavobacterium sp. RHBU_3]|uniref:M949_RS01915 family surface polysaccharide biosynthesis protein n=1 Tax=Flavobacterium sp. RHBU_3 TaxID=3391184 RepID=UPI00398530AC
MHYLKIIAATLLLATLPAGQEPLPAEIKFEGKQKEVLKWDDAEGKHLLLLTETGPHTNKKFKHDSDGTDAELFAYHYLYDASSKKYLQTWKVYDYINDCIVDMRVNFVPKAATHTDLNKNGIPEIWVVYQLQCTGDITPPDMKIIMYEGNSKYAVRGNRGLIVDKKVHVKAHHTFDKALNTADPAVKDFANKLWKKHEDFKYE